MKIMPHDLPITRMRPVYRQRCRRGETKAAAEEFGVTASAISEWRRRHPEKRTLPTRVIAKIVAENKRRWKK